MGKKSFKEDASGKNGNPPPFPLNSDQILLAVPVIWSQVLSSQISTLIVLENFVVGDVLHDGMRAWISLSISTSLQSLGLEGKGRSVLGCVLEHSGQSSPQRCVCNLSAPTKQMFEAQT